MNSERLKECTLLSCEILKNIELSELAMKNIILKCLRLCRLLDDDIGFKYFTFEASGYPTDENGYMTNEAWTIAAIAGRRYFKKDDKGKSMEYAFTELLAEMEEANISFLERMKVAKDPESYSGQITPLAITTSKNIQERTYISNEIQKNVKKIEKLKGNIYNFILNIYNGLQYGNFIEDIFTQNRKYVDENMGFICLESIKKFVSIYDNMDSKNPEDWANAVHSCRRILKDVADNLYPPSDVPIEINGKKIKIGEDQYINRLVQYIESKSGSKTYKDVVGSNLSSIGERLDSINKAICKGTHTVIEKEEANRYIIHTYILLGDILSL